MSKQIRIGKTDLYVNPIGLGTNAIGGHNLFTHLSEDTGRVVLRTALEEGINFWDTAFIYGPERSEELIGEILKDTGKRENVVLATKGAHKFIDGKVVLDNSPDFLKSAVESSLKRLQTDYIDLFYIHFPDEDTPKDEAVGALKELRDAGKIKALGVSNFSFEQLIEANKDGYVDVLQSEYNLFKREAEQDLLPYTAENNISFIPYFPLASGLLGGKYNKDSTFEDGRAKSPLFQGQAFVSNLQKVEEVRAIANRKNADVADVVLAWYLTRHSIDVLIPGAKKPEQVTRNLKALDVELTMDEIAEISAIFA
ncbi:aldo/keto reductase [Peribacillus muralis]|uniref:aldo/keto reductase n=1 Tax=Peribacillus muralis TaxID=264697 RepID=UPI001F4E3274|nr:aldo/keto reductase [Peribacillus muralis]MCK1994103.1 aldo/keto reductase [Peribacillus muralis]MCK2014658.1 aldo/keto reductase [Peribacillus muralis]